MNWQWLAANTGRIVDLSLAHLKIAVPAIVLAFVIAVPLGWAAHRTPRLRELIVVASGMVFVVPSLAMFILMPLVLSTSILSPLNVVAAMTLYGVALMVRAAADAFDTVPSSVQQSAIAAGYAPARRVFAVDLPLAGPGLLAGLRVVAASTISLVSVGALIGVPSLGTLFTEGFQRSFPTQILAGIGGTVVLALLIDAALVLTGRITMPWARQVR